MRDIRKTAFSTYIKPVNPNEPEDTCTEFTITVLVPTNIVFYYTPCGSGPTSITLNEDDGPTTLCCTVGPYTTAASSKYTIFFGDSCGSSPAMITSQPSNKTVHDVNNDSSEVEDFTPNVITTDIANPERGLYHHTEVFTSSYVNLDESILTSYRTTENVNLILRVVYLDNFLTSDMLVGNTATDVLLDNLQTDFNKIRNAGLKVILRFAYTDEEGVEGDNSHNPDLDRIKNHINTLSTIINSNKDVIATLQAGFIGTWGEWWYTDYFGWAESGADPTNVSLRNELLQHYLERTDNDIFLQVRTPKFKKDFLGITTPLTSGEAYSETYASRLGHHDDAFLADATHFGTYEDRIIDQNYLQADATYVPNGGETCTTSNSYTTCSNAQVELTKLNISFLNKDYHESIVGDGGEWDVNGCRNTIKKNLGYRIGLTTFQTSVNVTNNLPIKIELTNTGYAAPYINKDVKVVLKSTTIMDDIYEISLDLDIRFLKSATTIDTTLDVSGVTPGNYDMFLKINDKHIDRDAYNIRLANDTIWSTINGDNNLGVSITKNDTTPLSVTFEVTADNADTYQWQKRILGVWTDLTDFGTTSGTTTSILTITGFDASYNGSQYRVIINEATDNIISNVATLTIT